MSKAGGKKQGGSLPAAGGASIAPTDGNDVCSVWEVHKKYRNGAIASMKGQQATEEQYRDNDFQPFSFDFESMFDQLTKEIEQNSRDVANSEELFENYEANFTEAAHAMGYTIPNDVILGIYKGDEEKLQVPTFSDMKGTLEKSCPGWQRHGTGSMNSDGTPASKKFKADVASSGRAISQNSSEVSNKNTSFSAVAERTTAQSKAIPLKKSDELPEGLKIASNQEKYPQVSAALPNIPLGSLQGTTRNIRGTECGSGKPLTPNPRSETTCAVAATPIAVVSPVPSTVEKKGTSSASGDTPNVGATPLLKQIERDTQKKAQISSPTSRLVYNKSRPANSPQIAETVTQTTTVKTPNTSAVPEFELIPVESTGPKPLNPNPGSFRVTQPPAPSKATVPSPIKPQQQQQKVTATLPQRSDIPETRSPLHGTPATSTPVRIISAKAPPSVGQAESKIKAIYSCKYCREQFLCYDDDLYRRHVFLKHNYEINEKTLQETRGIPVTNKIKQCTKCKDYVVNVEEHRAKCRESAFETVEIQPNKLLKHVCGIGGCGRPFSSKYELKFHIDSEHGNFKTKVIVDPGFRCAQCLQKFDNSYDLTSHCTNCTLKNPTKDTVMELAKTFLWCDLCGLEHEKTADTSACFLKRSILRCVLCFAMTKEKSRYYQHLQQHHSSLFSSPQSPKINLCCPICEIIRGKYTTVFPHIVTDHFQPAVEGNFQVSVEVSASAVVTTDQSRKDAIVTGKFPSQNCSNRKSMPLLQPIPPPVPRVVRPVTPPVVARPTNAVNAIVINRTPTFTGSLASSVITSTAKQPVMSDPVIVSAGATTVTRVAKPLPPQQQIASNMYANTVGRFLGSGPGLIPVSSQFNSQPPSNIKYPVITVANPLARSAQATINSTTGPSYPIAGPPIVPVTSAPGFSISGSPQPRFSTNHSPTVPVLSLSSSSIGSSVPPRAPNLMTNVRIAQSAPGQIQMLRSAVRAPAPSQISSAPIPSLPAGISVSAVPATLTSAARLSSPSPSGDTLRPKPAEVQRVPTPGSFPSSLTNL